MKGGEANERNPDRPVKRWQELYQVWKRGKLRAYFDAQVLHADAIEAGLRDGRYVVDERLKQMLKRLRSNMVLPKVT